MVTPRKSAEAAAESATQSAESLRRSLEDLIAEARGLRQDVTAANAQRRKENLVTISVGILLSIFIILILGVAVQTNAVSHDVKATNDQVVDCTVAGGNCYKKGVARTASAISDIVRASVYVAECARLRPGQSGPAFDKAIEACVAGKLAAKKK